MGPTLAGFTVEYFGFRATTFGFVIAYAVVLCIDLVELAYTVRLNNKQVGVVITKKSIDNKST